MFALGILSSMFSGGGFGSPSPSIDYLKKTLEEDEKKNQEQVYAIPLNENKAE
jgi:hypothetical protein